MVEQVEALLAVVSLGSFSAAGSRLGVAQSTVSRRVAALEAAVGVDLLTRPAGEAPALTAAGRAYLAKAPAILRAVAAAEAICRR
jgi:DNA-binding transcriptional LysR family regulator